MTVTEFIQKDGIERNLDKCSGINTVITKTSLV